MKAAWTSLPTVVVFAALAASGAWADAPPSDNITVKGDAPAVCSLGGWEKESGPGDFSAGYNAVATYDESDLIGSDGTSALGPGSALTFHAPLLCNTPITWSFATSKGAFRLDSASVPPAGFSSQWLYQLKVGPYDSSGSAVGFSDSLTSNGSPVYESFGLDQNSSESIAYMGLVFTPVAQTTHMLAGHYSETITLTVSPSL